MLSYWFLTGALLGNVQNVHCRSTVLRIIPLEILCKYLEYCLFQYLLQNNTMPLISYSVSIFQQVQSMVARTAIDSSFNKTYESMQTAVSDRSDCREVLQCIEATAAHRPLPLLTPPQ